MISSNAEIGQLIQHSLDLYHQLGQPCIGEYRVALQEHQAVIRVGDQRFHLPLFETK